MPRYWAFYALLRTASADYPCASAYYRGQIIAKRRIVAGARGHVAYVAGLEHTGHHLWHDGVFRQPGPWHDAYYASLAAGAMRDKTKTCANDEALGRALREDLACASDDVLLHLPSCSYPCGSAGATWHPDLPWLAAATEVAGFDFRVILATRLPVNIVQDADNGFTEGRILALARACRRLSGHLRRLDPRFLVCAPYPNAYSNTTALSRFLGVDVKSAIATSFHESARDDAGALAQAGTRARAAFGRLESCSRELDAFCAVATSPGAGVSGAPPGPAAACPALL